MLAVSSSERPSSGAGIAAESMTPSSASAALKAPMPPASPERPWGTNAMSNSRAMRFCSSRAAPQSPASAACRRRV